MEIFGTAALPDALSKRSTIFWLKTLPVRALIALNDHFLRAGEWLCWLILSRGDWIRTSDLLLPKQALYQAKLHPGLLKSVNCNAEAKNGEFFVEPSAKHLNRS